tara:strand:+ start:830 stop:1369 length:540 start_codon:yes stop_codon:yes gene_type:complete
MNTVNYCDLCGSYNHSEEFHEESETHAYNYFKYIEAGFKDMKIRKDIEEKDSIDVIQEYRKLEQTYDMESNDKECGNCYTDEGCDYTGTYRDVINHERECMGFERNVFNEKPKVSSNSITCKDCGSVFNQTAKGNKPKVLYNRHIKNGRCFRKCLRDVMPLMKTIDMEQFRQIKEILSK